MRSGGTIVARQGESQEKGVQNKTAGEVGVVSILQPGGRQLQVPNRLSTSRLENVFVPVVGVVVLRLPVLLQRGMLFAFPWEPTSID